MPPKRSRVPARRSRFLTPIFLSLVVLMACTHGGGSEPSDEGLRHAGGTLELSMVRGDFRSQYPGDPAVNLDPARDHTRTGMELLRCCLARTLLMPDDRPGHAGGLVPDLAATMPVVSTDGLTWTFRLRSGLTYAPPLDHTPIVAADLKRALTRVALLGDAAAYAYEFSPIEGFDAVVQGIASSITGVDVPDDRTLQIHLTAPTADLGYRLALPAAAPLPPSSKETATMGIATGHDQDYGEFLVSSGPYMYEGADRPDLERRSTDRPRGSGRYHARPEPFVGSGGRPDPRGLSEPDRHLDDGGATVGERAARRRRDARLPVRGTLDDRASDLRRVHGRSRSGDPVVPVAARRHVGHRDERGGASVRRSLHPPRGRPGVRHQERARGDPRRATSASTGWYNTGIPGRSHRARRSGGRSIDDVRPVPR